MFQDNSFEQKWISWIFYVNWLSTFSDLWNKWKIVKKQTRVDIKRMYRSSEKVKHAQKIFIICKILFMPSRSGMVSVRKSSMQTISECSNVLPSTWVKNKELRGSSCRHSGWQLEVYIGRYSLCIFSFEPHPLGPAATQNATFRKTTEQLVSSEATNRVTMQRGRL